MKTFTGLLAVLVLALTATACVFAQGFNPAGAPPWVYADNYGRWAIQGQKPNTYTFSNVNGCQVTQLDFADSPTFYAFADTLALAPILIQDQNQATSEVLTPSSYLVPSELRCGVNIAPVNPHTTFTLQSGTGGLQEALNAVGGTHEPALMTVVLSPEWYKLVANIHSQDSAVTAATILAAATCSAKTGVVDVTTNPWTF
jgi:hypothetical protein